jgi:hypothetical protein
LIGGIAAGVLLGQRERADCFTPREWSKPPLLLFCRAVSMDELDEERVSYDQDHRQRGADLANLLDRKGITDEILARPAPFRGDRNRKQSFRARLPNELARKLVFRVNARSQRAHVRLRKHPRPGTEVVLCG